MGKDTIKHIKNKINIMHRACSAIRNLHGAFVMTAGEIPIIAIELNNRCLRDSWCPDTDWMKVYRVEDIEFLNWRDNSFRMKGSTSWKRLDEFTEEELVRVKEYFDHMIPHDVI